MELKEGLFREDRLNAQGRKDSKRCWNNHFHYVGNTDGSFPHAVEEKEGQVQDFPKILKYNLEPPPTIMTSRSPLLEYLWPGSL